MASQSVHSFFAQLTRVPNTDTDTQTTLRGTSVSTGRFYAMHAMQPNNNKRI